MRRLAMLLTLAALFLCSSASPAATKGGAVVKAAVNAQLGTKILVDARGRTLYLFGQDGGGASTCANDPTFHCSKVWPPLLTMGAPKAGPGIKASLLGTIRRDEGTMQVTYAGHPLYTLKGGGGSGIAGNRKPGDVNGQGLVSLWWVVSPAGKKITKAR